MESTTARESGVKVKVALLLAAVGVLVSAVRRAPWPTKHGQALVRRVWQACPCTFSRRGVLAPSVASRRASACTRPAILDLRRARSCTLALFKIQSGP